MGFRTPNQLLEAILKEQFFRARLRVHPRVHPTEDPNLYMPVEKPVLNCFPKTGQKTNSLADPGGVEPPTLGLGGRCPILARPRVHN